MLNQLKNSKIQTKLKIFTLTILIISIIWVLGTNTVEQIDYSSQSQTLDSDWLQYIDGEWIELENISDYQKVAVTQEMILETTIPDIYYDKVLYFFTKDIEVSVFIDDVLVYELKMQDGYEFLETPGNAWNKIDIASQYAGSTLKLVMTSNFLNRYYTTLNELNFINESECLSVVLKQELFSILLSFSVMLMAFMAYINSFIWKRKSIKKYFFSLANLYLCTGLWLIAMYNGYDFFFSKPLLSYLISMLMAVFIPVTVYELFRTLSPKKNKLIAIFGWIAWGCFLLQMILQFTLGISFLTMLPLTYIIYGLGAFLCLLLVIQHIAKNIKTKTINVHFASTLIIFIGAIIEVIVLIVFPERTDLIGLASVSGLFVYLLFNNINFSKIESKIDVEKIMIEENYNKLQGTTLMQQIKAHFFFNTLNTISSLCKYDAKEANRAINIFAQYMKSYMRLINENNNIEFERELKIVEASLEIEKLRFPDKFTYEIDLKVTNFKIPPLSIQPIVENSMIHGLRKADKIGKITVATKDFTDHIEVIVSDNGVGFDVDSLLSNQAIGLKNLQKRFKLMVDGEVKIESQYDVGTKTTLIIPK